MPGPVVGVPLRVRGVAYRAASCGDERRSAVTARASGFGLPALGVGLLASGMIGVAASRLGAQAPTFRAGVAVVRVNVLATDRGRPVAGLKGDDFEVRDNGVLQQVEATYGESEPLDVLFAFDRSQSMAGETLGRLGDAARAVLEQLGPDDRAGLVTFNQTF